MIKFSNSRLLFFIIVFLGILTEKGGAQAWQFIAPMQVTRSEPCVVQLDNGLILVAGGSGPNSALASCELYDPSTNTWRYTGALNQARYRGEIAKLNDGRVLVAGGLTNLGATTTATCEIYDPKTETWKYTAPLSDPRQNFDNVKLPDGKILFAGGLNSNTIEYLASCDLFDPVTESFLPFPPMLIGTYGTNLFYSPTINSLVIPGGMIGGSAGFYVRSTQIYSFATNSWSLADSLQVPHSNAHGQSVQMPDDRIIHPSGRNGQTIVTPLVEEFNYTTKTWKTLGDLNPARFLATTFAINNDSILVVGGVADPEYYQKPLKECTWFDLRKGVSSAGPPLNNARFGHRALHYLYRSPLDTCSLIERIYVFGGGDKNRFPLSTCEVLDLRNISGNGNLNITALPIRFDSIGCLARDTTLTITFQGCTELQLEKIILTDSTSLALEVLDNLPVHLGAITNLKLRVTAKAGKAVRASLMLRFKAPNGDSIIRFDTISTIIKRPIIIDLPQTLSLTGTVCEGAAIELPIHNSLCSEISLKSIDNEGDLKISLTSIDGFKDSLIILSDETVKPKLHFKITEGGEYDCYVHLKFRTEEGVVDSTVKVHISVLPQNGQLSVLPLLIDSMGCSGLDTVITVIYVGCDPVVLDSVQFADNNAFTVSLVDVLPLNVKESLQLRCKILQQFSTGGNQVMGRFYFRNANGDLIVKDFDISLNKQPAILSLPKDPIATGTLCDGINVLLPIGNRYCSNLWVKSVVLSNAPSEIGQPIVKGFEDSLEIGPGQTSNVLLTFTPQKTGEYECLVKLRVAGTFGDFDTILPLHLSVEAKNVYNIQTLLPDVFGAHVDDTIEVPLYILVDGEDTIKNFRLNLQFNKDLLELLSPDLSGTQITPTSIYDLQNTEFGCSLFIPHLFDRASDLPLIKLRFHTFLTTTLCDTIRIGNLTLESSKESSCYSVLLDSAQVCLQPRCGDQTIQDVMRVGTPFRFTVYPNPVAREVNLTATESGRLEVIDPLGSTVKVVEISGRGDQTYDVSSLLPGAYFFRFSANKKVATQRVVIRR